MRALRRVSAEAIEDEVASLCVQANTVLRPDVIAALERALDSESSPIGRGVLRDILDNARLAGHSAIPMCQDTGLAVVFVELGQDVHIDGDLYRAINAGVERGYREGYLRMSVLNNPLERVSTGTNTPAVIHVELVPGDRLTIHLAPKGAGSENTSALAMLKPSAGHRGVIDYVLGVVETAGPNACPPLVVGVGLGGTMETAALLAKRALLEPIGQQSSDPAAAELERELLERINGLGIGPGGLGGTTTALWVSVKMTGCHIASLPVAVNLCCHAVRHATAQL